jgi:integrase
MPKLSSKVISDLTVRSARPKAARYEIRDAELRGFMLRVSPSGSKSWYVQLDRVHKQKIGDARVLTASMARYRARDLLQRASRLQFEASAARPLTLGSYLSGPYSQWIGRRTQFGQRDTRRLHSALGALAEERLDRVGLSQIERWRLKRSAQVKPATLQREIAALNAALNRAVARKLIPENPLQRMKIRKGHAGPEIRVLSDLEKAALMEYLEGRDGHPAAMVLTALNTGLTRSELFRLRWQDVHFGIHAAVEVRPGRRRRNQPRRIPLNAQAETVLQQWKKNRRRRGTLVFPSPSGGMLKSIDTAWKSLLRDTGIRNFNFSDCRHEFAVRLVRAGVSLGQVRDLLGHSSIALTERYAPYAPGSARAAVQKLLQN